MSKIRINAITSLLVQFVSAIIGLIIPKLIITKYGSETNGLIMSIAQLLSYISLLEAGVGGVICASLYKPLVDKDELAISSIVNATSAFFKKIAKLFVIYLLFVIIFYPLCIKNESWSHLNISFMIAILGIETFFQYYFGISHQMLLQAGQQVYIVNILQITTLVLNALITIILINLNMPIHLVKLISMFIFSIRPCFIYRYVKKKYKINRMVGFTKETIKHRWEGVGQHIAFVIHNNTDMVILSLFSSLKEVSVYSLYMMVVATIRKLVLFPTTSMSSAMGTLYAAGEKEKLNKLFSKYEGFIFIVATILLTITAVMIVPFISIYTMKVKDISYIRPVFASLVVLTEYIYIVREPFKNLVLSLGFYKETSGSAYLEAIVNVLISVLLVWNCGIVGVMVGTLVAVSVRTVDLVRFLRNNILYRSYKPFIKNLIVSLCCAIGGYIFSIRFILPLFSLTSYLSWALCSIVVSIFVLGTILIVNLIFNRNTLISALNIFDEK